MRIALDGKSALITGASSGVGEAIARAFAPYKMRLGLIARTKEKLDALAEEVRSLGSEALVLPGDLTDPILLDNSVKAFKSEFGVPDYLINNAGIGTRSCWLDTSLERELEILAVNYIAPVSLIRQVLPDMLAKGIGHIININSLAGLWATPYCGSYSASKSALLSYSSSLSFELQDTNVHITSICPGPINTSFLDSPNYSSFKDAKDIVSPDYIATKVVSSILAPRETILVGSTFKKFALKIFSLYPERFRNLVESKNTPPRRPT